MSDEMMMRKVWAQCGPTRFDAETPFLKQSTAALDRHSSLATTILQITQFAYTCRCRRCIQCRYCMAWFMSYMLSLNHNCGVYRRKEKLRKIKIVKPIHQGLHIACQLRTMIASG